MNEPLIKFRNVSKRFGSKVVLDGIDLDIFKGEVTTIIGKSGVGKSVLIKHIIGLLTPDNGTISIEGNNLWDLNRKQWRSFKERISYMFQHNALFDSLTIFENIALPLKERTSNSSASIREKVEQRMEQLELLDVGHKYPSQLSGGMQKRVALARALVTDPEIVLFDEPTTGLDPIRKNAVLSMVAQYQKQFGFTAILISHDIPDVFYISNRVAILNEGKIIYQGHPKDLDRFSHPVVDDFVHSLDNLKEELTGLVTRRSFDCRLEDEELAGFLRPTSKFLVFVVSITNINDVINDIGEIAVQYILQELSLFLDKHIGPVGLSTRYMEHEILALLPRSAMSEIEQLRNRFIEDVQENGILESEHFPVIPYDFKFSAGVAEGWPGKDLVALVAQAQSQQEALGTLKCVRKSA